MESFKQKKYDRLYLDIAQRVSEMSYGKRYQMGAIAVKGDRIISLGWNGQPSGFDNCCEDDAGKSKPTVIHAEANLLTKIAKSTESSCGCTIYCTNAPCIECAKLLAQAEIVRYVYANDYITYEKVLFTDGIDLLKAKDIIVDKIFS